MLSKSKLILIIEDEKKDREKAKKIVESQGFLTITASDGYEGLDFLSRNKDDINLVFLDVMMPGINGLEVLKAISGNRDKYGKPPVILLTNVTNEAIVREAFDLGASSYLCKKRSSEADVKKELKKYLDD